MVGTNTAFILYENAIDKDTCNRIIELGKDKWQDALVGIKKREKSLQNLNEEERKGEFDIAHKFRCSEIMWVEQQQQQWIFDIIEPLLHKANTQADWKYDITGAEPVQLTRYRAEASGHYAWHQDGQGDHIAAYNVPDNPILHGKVRKLTIIVSLNDEFEGGVFEFASYQKGKCSVTPLSPVKQGNVVVFPSTLEHRVPPVTKGTRYSLITWFVGQPFR